MNTIVSYFIKRLYSITPNLYFDILKHELRINRKFSYSAYDSLMLFCKFASECVKISETKEESNRIRYQISYMIKRAMIDVMNYCDTKIPFEEFDVQPWKIKSEINVNKLYTEILKCLKYINDRNLNNLDIYANLLNSQNARILIEHYKISDELFITLFRMFIKSEKIKLSNKLCLDSFFFSKFEDYMRNKLFPEKVFMIL